MIDEFLPKASAALQEHGWVGLLVLAGSVSRAFLDAAPITIIRIARLIVIGSFAGALAALVLDGTDYSTGTKGAMIGVTSLLAEDILVSLLALGTKLRTDPTSAINWLLRRK